MQAILRPYQEEGINSLRTALKEGHKRVMLQAATGAGKTVIASAVISMAREKGSRVIFTVPAISLVDQTIQAFHKQGIEGVGVIQADHWLTDHDQPVQVASIQTLMRRPIPDAQLVIVDEAHRWFKFYEKWMNKLDWRHVPFVGLSATPWTKGLGKHFSKLIVVATTKTLIEQGYLSPFRVFASAHPDLTDVKTVKGDYHEGQLAERMNQRALVADVVSTWQRYGENRPTLCFGVNCAHAQHLQQQFEEAGIPCAYQDAYTDEWERRRIRDEFHAGRIKVVCNVGTLTTGVDWDVRCIILARPTKSEMLHVQIIGRGLRLAEGKKDCLILDHADNNLRLGFVDQIHHPELNQGTKGDKDKKIPLPKECSQCGYLKPPGMGECPNCGHRPAKPPNTVEADPSLQLMEITPGKKERAEMAPEQKRAIYGMLKRIARQREYKPGWVAYSFKGLCGGWPHRSWQTDVPEMEPAPWVRSWVRAQDIRRAKARQKAAAE